MQAVITAGLYPNVITVDTGPPGGPKKTPKLLTRSGEVLQSLHLVIVSRNLMCESLSMQVFLHPSCVDHQNEATLDSRMLVYYELVKTAKVFPITPCAVGPLPPAR